MNNVSAYLIEVFGYEIDEYYNVTVECYIDGKYHNIDLTAPLIEQWCEDEMVLIRETINPNNPEPVTNYTISFEEFMIMDFNITHCKSLIKYVLKYYLISLI